MDIEYCFVWFECMNIWYSTSFDVTLQVEFLWQMVLQMLDLLSSRQTAEGRSSSGAVKEAGGGTKATMEITLEFSSADSLTEGRNIDLRDDQDETEVDFSKRGRLR